MRLTTFSDYSLRVLMYLALDVDRQATIPEIAAAYGISEHHLTKVVHRLGRGGVVVATRGKGGGIRLARAPENIRLGEVVRAAEGEGAIVECQLVDAGNCRIAGACQFFGILVDAFDAFYATLDAHTLADLVAKPKPLRRALPVPA